MVELNCETDFVARNKQFLSLLQEVSALNISACKNLGEGLKHLTRNDLEALPQKDGKTLSDLIALNIGVIGENISPKKAAWMTLSEEPNTQLIGFTHPSGAMNSETMTYGKYGVLMELSKDPSNGILPEDHSIESMGRQLCQHVIGMYINRTYIHMLLCFIGFILFNPETLPFVEMQV